MRSPVALSALFVVVACVSTPLLAHAGCMDALRLGTAEVGRDRAISDATLTSIGASCAGEPGAALVNELVRIGRCDSAAQIGRALSSGGGDSLDAAVDAADRCLASTVSDRLDDLSAAVTEAEAMDAAAIGGLADIGSLGSGHGGGGATGADRDGNYWGPTSQPTRSAPRGEDAWGGELKSKNNESQQRAARASTGAGRYVASPVGDAGDSRVAIADGAPVAWSRLDLGVWFDYDSASLRPEALATLAALATRLQSMNPGTVLEIVGHTDSDGSWGYNLGLSGRRAESVRTALLLSGSPASKLGTRAMGESDPVASNRTWSGRAQNRRVEFRFLQTVARRLTR